MNNASSIKSDQRDGLAELTSELEAAIRFRDQIADEYDGAVSIKQQIEVDLSDPNVVSSSGLRMDNIGYHTRRQKLVKQKCAIELRLTKLKKTRHSWNLEVTRLTGLLKKEQQAHEDENDIAMLEGRLNLATANEAKLRSTIIEWENKYIKLERQYSFVVDQLNAMKARLREMENA